MKWPESFYDGTAKTMTAPTAGSLSLQMEGGGGGGHLKRKIPLPSIQFEYPNAPESDGSASNSDRLGRPIIYVLRRSIASKVALS